MIFATDRRTLESGGQGLRSQFLQVVLVPCEVFVPPTGPFGGWFRFSPFDGLFLSLSVIFSNYRRTLKPGDPGLRGQFLQVALVLCEVFVPPTGSFGGWFGFSPFNGLFLSLSVIFANYRHTLKPGDPGLRGQFLQVTLLPYEVFVPPMGSMGGVGLGFNPLTAFF